MDVRIDGDAYAPLPETRVIGCQGDGVIRDELIDRTWQTPATSSYDPITL
jgi:hypothetical protein